jgi:multidrug resistance efflux pump
MPALLLVGWILWAATAELPLHAAALRAEVVADAAHESLHWLGSPVDAQVATMHVRLGDRVAAGDLLVEFVPGPAAARTASLRARMAELGGAIEALEAAVPAQRNAALQAAKAMQKRSSEDAARTRQARLAYEHAQAELARHRELADRGLLPASDLQVREFRARSRAVELELATTAEQRAEIEAREDDQRHRVEESRLGAELAGLRAEREQVVADLLDHDALIERHRLRAPVAGRVIEAKVLNPGAMAAQGEPLLAIAPDPRVTVRARRRVTAYFAQEDVLGRMRVGQLAHVHPLNPVHGQDRRIPAAVATIGEPASDGNVRVDLITQLEPATDVEALVRGRAVHVLVEVEQRTPWHWAVAAITNPGTHDASP